MALCLEPFGELSLELAKPFDVGERSGVTRRVIQATSGTFRGPRLSGIIVGPSADWFAVTADGIGLIDGRLTVQVPSGFVQLMYGGRADYSTRRNAPAHVWLTFDTAVEDLAYLAGRLAVGVGRLAHGTLTYEVALLS